MKKMGFNIEGGGDREKETSEFHNKTSSPSKNDETCKFPITNGQAHYNYYPKSSSNKSSMSGRSYPPSPSHHMITNDDIGMTISSANSNGHSGNNLSHSLAVRQGSSLGSTSVNPGSMHLAHLSKSSKSNSLHIPTTVLPNQHQDLRHSRSPNATTLIENAAEHLQQIEAMAGLMRNNMNSGSRSHNYGAKSDTTPAINGNPVGPNVNGPVSATPGVPTNESELQLYRVLQRANLLRYFDVMIELGGDDVQQLCEAGEDEFLEIMALIGMASKPLHVRRLQKALQEWMTQPSLFQAMYYQQALPFNKAGIQPGSLQYAPDVTESQAQLSKYMLNQVANNSTKSQSHTQNKIPIRPIAYHSGSSSAVPTKPPYVDPHELKSFQSKLHYLRPQDNIGYQSSSNSNSPTNNIPIQNNTHLNIPGGNIMSSNSKSPNHSSTSNSSSHSSNSFQIPSITIQRAFYEDQEKDRDPESVRISVDQIIPSHFLEQRIRTRSEPNTPSPSVSPRPSISPIPFLQDFEVQKLSEAAAKLLNSLPPTISEPRMSARKKSCEDFEAVIRVPEKDPKRMDEIRKYAAVYGRYDCKRKLQKPLTLNELSVNEAAAQMCKHIPALLTRRDELFPLARQVVRDSGLPYCTTSSTNLSISLIPNTNNINSKSSIPEENTSHGGLNGFSSKRLRLDVRGIEIHEYNRPPSNSNESNHSEDSLQISNSAASSNPTSPSCTNIPLNIPSPHERVTITSVRKKSIGTFQPPGSPLGLENINLTTAGGGNSFNVHRLTNNPTTDKDNNVEKTSDEFNAHKGENDSAVTVKVEQGE